MTPMTRAALALSLTTALGTPALADEFDISASIGVEARTFFEDPAFAGQSDDTAQFSGIFEAELNWRSDDRQHQFVFMPWARLDSMDEERSHADIRELYYRYRGDTFETQVGLIKVFWGTAESRHLVDIVNQTDAVEDIDGEDKLGQPAIRVRTQQDWGRIEAFVLPYFREQTAPGIEGRLRGALPLDWDNALYESSDEEEHIDYALRYSHYIGDWDIGLSFFDGTSREATFRFTDNGSVLTPYYAQITQAGIDLQYTNDAWLWKFEGIVRDGHGDTFGAAVGGFEYTFYGVSEAGADLGVLVEYQFDDRDENPLIAPITPADNDLFVGARYALNDMQDTSILAGSVIDMDNGTTTGVVEAERRIGTNWKLEFEARLFLETDEEDPLDIFKDDNAATLRMTRYF